MRTLVFALLVIAGCGSSVGPGSRTVGGSCTVDANCEHRCVGGSHYPTGLCTLTCLSTADCPEGTACVDDSGGICAVLCSEVGNCAQFGAAYLCDARDYHGSGGKASVCRVP